VIADVVSAITGSPAHGSAEDPQSSGLAYRRTVLIRREKPPSREKGAAEECQEEESLTATNPKQVGQARQRDGKQEVRPQSGDPFEKQHTSDPGASSRPLRGYFFDPAVLARSIFSSAL